MNGVALGTIVSQNYVAFAHVLAESLQRHHPEVNLVVVVADTDDAAELHVPDLQRVRFQCTRQELVVTLKPFLLQALLERAESALFIDADVLVLGSLDELFAAVRGHAVTLVPHALRPPATSDALERDLLLNQAGAFNGGVVGVSRHPQAHAFLDWWQRRLHRLCRHDLERGVHFDQRWLDLAPVFVEDLHVHRDPGVNVAYWNLPERRLPCTLFHFSGFEPDRPEQVTRYHPSLRLADVGEAALLFDDYAQSLNAAGWQETRLVPYAYASFSNGVPIPDAARRLYAELPDRDRFGDPFEVEGASYFEWLRQGTPSPLWLHVHGERADLQYAFPDPRRRDRRRFLAWTRTHGMYEDGIPSALV